MHRIEHLARERVELREAEGPEPLTPDRIRSRTLCTLVSPGTELACCYQGEKFPSVSGYAAVCEVLEAGGEAREFSAGDTVFCMRPHQSLQCSKRDWTWKVPKGLPPEVALLSRLMNVSMTTLVDTSARPGDKVLVTGLGPVGYLGAELFRASGYEVTVCDPDERRLRMARERGYERAFRDLADAAPGEDFALVLECSGREEAAVEGARRVRRKGEVVLVGVPWRQRAEINVFRLLEPVFHRYATVRGGWEWSLPQVGDDNHPYSIRRNLDLCLDWLAKGLVRHEGLSRVFDPKDCQAVYQGHLYGTHEHLFSIFDWRSY